MSSCHQSFVLLFPTLHTYELYGENIHRSVKGQTLENFTEASLMHMKREQGLEAAPRSVMYKSGVTQIDAMLSASAATAASALRFSSAPSDPTR